MKKQLIFGRWMSQERGDCSRTAGHSITEYVITRHELALPFIFQQTNISQLLLIKIDHTRRRPYYSKNLMY